MKFVINCKQYSLLLFALIRVGHDSVTGLSFVDWFYGYDSNTTRTKVSNLSALTDLSQLRVRDLKRRLARQHGYGADEISKMIDKKDLINTLLYEEHKVYQKEEQRRKRTMYRRRIMTSLICIAIVMFRDLWIQLYELVSVNVLVYTDKKLYEISRCREYKSLKGLIGITFMIILDLLQGWLTLSVLLSWFMTSSYFFPIPSIPIKPAQLLATMAGSSKSAGPLSNYGINIGSMVITWFFRFAYGRVEGWTGKKLSESYAQRRKEEKEAAKSKRHESYDENWLQQREARRAAREERRKMKERRRNQNLEEQDILRNLATHERENDFHSLNENREIDKADDHDSHQDMNQVD